MADKPYKPLQILLTPEQHAEFKTLCAMRGVKMTEVTKEMIDRWISEEIKKSPWLRIKQ